MLVGSCFSLLKPSSGLGLVLFIKMITLRFQILSVFKKTKLMDCEMGSNFLDQQFCDKSNLYKTF